ncbi:MAG TPA: site-specific integrase, partial [Candidatus Saccharimonadales bacterium]|nr:site-specific integrase [Candidatus Saccharimonadales bacterium]
MEKVNVRVAKLRRRKNGRVVVSPFYQLFWSVKGHGQGQFSLKVRDLQVAEKLKSEFISEKERELSGVTAPRLVRDAAGRLLTDHLAEFLAYMEGLNRSASHISHVGTRVGKLIADCGWRYLSDVNAKAFELWRQKKSDELSVKTRNEYRASMYSMLAWLEENEQLAANPFKRVKKTDGRGQETVKRRAATQAEMESLLSGAGIYAVAYLAAATTGLRRGELSKLEGGDLHLDVAQPVALVRAATTKDRKPARVYLARQLVAELKKLHSLAMPSNSLVLAGRMPTTKKMREHLAEAGIPYMDDQGRRLDFHALRMTFDTNLAIAGVSDAVRMKLMRHKSPRLTMETYTDSEKVPVAGALAKLPEFGCWENGKEHTGKDTEILVQGGQSVSKPVTIASALKCDKTPANIGESHGQSPIVILGHQ